MPNIEALRNRMQQMSAITAVFAAGNRGTPFEFHPKWARHEQVGVVDDGCGDTLFVHFVPEGCFIKGFAHESNMTPYNKNPPQLWPGLLESVPDVFAPSINEPAFEISATTFVIWRLANDGAWSTSEVERSDGDYGDGSADLLDPLGYTHREFSEWLQEYYEVVVDGAIVESVFNNLPLRDCDMTRLNPSRSRRVLRKAVRRTGYTIT